MSFRSPAMPMTSSGAEWHICWRSARARSRCPATNERAVNLTVQLTVDELSHCSPAWRCWRDGTRCSRASHPRSTPAISRSFIEISPFSNALTTSGEKSTDQNTYLYVLSANGRIQTPPAPYLQASVYPCRCGSLGTNCATFIGWFAISLKSHRKSAKVSLISFERVIYPFFSFAMACQIVVNKPRPPGIPMDAW